MKCIYLAECRVGVEFVGVCGCCHEVATLSATPVALDDVSALRVEYPQWMNSLGDDRLPGQFRDLDALTKKNEQ